MTNERDGVKVHSRRGRMAFGSLAQDDGNTTLIYMSPGFDWTIAPYAWTADMWTSDDPKALDRSGFGVNGTAWAVDYREGELEPEDIRSTVAVRAVRSL